MKNSVKGRSSNRVDNACFSSVYNKAQQLLNKGGYWTDPSECQRLLSKFLLELARESNGQYYPSLWFVSVAKKRLNDNIDDFKST